VASIRAGCVLLSGFEESHREPLIDQRFNVTIKMSGVNFAGPQPNGKIQGLRVDVVADHGANLMLGADPTNFRQVLSHRSQFLRIAAAHCSVKGVYHQTKAPGGRGLPLLIRASRKGFT